jgi:hypothetical protein
VKVGPTSQTRHVEWRTVGEMVRFCPLNVGVPMSYGVFVHSPAATSTKITINASEPERLWLEKQARNAGITMANYIRQKLGLRARPMGRPTAVDLDDMQDDAWSRLVEVGEDPRQYFPQDLEQVKPEEEDTQEEREALCIKLRALNARLSADEKAKAELARNGQPLQ